MERCPRFRFLESIKIRREKLTMHVDDDMIARIIEKIDQSFPGRTAVEARCERVIKLGEEAGEAQGAALRLMNMTRRTGDTAELAEELADVVITALTVARMFGIDMESAIDRKVEKVFARGFRDAAPSAELVDTAMTQLLLPAAAVPGERTAVIPRMAPRPHEYVAAWSAQDGACAHLYMLEGMSSPEHCGREYRHPVHDAAARVPSPGFLPHPYEPSRVESDEACAFVWGEVGGLRRCGRPHADPTHRVA